ncbi:hypothetical protein ACTXKQ_12960 [Corynebacterium variabile]|uniref:hypothetical protein n=1 Tax=Corynebacterium TaxID=1716 RepID=UPI002648D506|nr:hypothetical protein [Corynebacterium sp.]MDN6304483.1 hypothetical protein [Corynebacterium sp.]MDN6354410.1 hypothetical protein [Corynebacterium sp.]MDN6366318.1 hypothetical protein [Corynebacterium sp.]MDN6395076.1 hypothetical protein [Corynebacterium sp.]
MSDDHIVTPMGSMTPESWAAVTTKRPGMYLGGVSFERAVGFVRGLEHPLIVRCRTQEEINALPTSRHSELLIQGDLDDTGAIRRLEPLLVDLFTALQELR